MCKRNNQSLFFTCALIEQIGRELRVERRQVVEGLCESGIQTIYDHADVLHCEPIQKVADDFIREYRLSGGSFDNVNSARYVIPDVWTVGKIYARLIEDVSEDDTMIETLMRVYASWISEAISDYNTSFYYQSRDYITESYRQGHPAAG